MSAYNILLAVLTIVIAPVATVISYTSYSYPRTHLSRIDSLTYEATVVEVNGIMRPRRAINIGAYKYDGTEGVDGSRAFNLIKRFNMSIGYNYFIGALLITAAVLALISVSLTFAYINTDDIQAVMISNLLFLTAVQLVMLIKSEVIEGRERIRILKRTYEIPLQEIAPNRLEDYCVAIYERKLYLWLANYIGSIKQVNSDEVGIDDIRGPASTKFVVLRENANNLYREWDYN